MLWYYQNCGSGLISYATCMTLFTYLNFFFLFLFFVPGLKRLWGFYALPVRDIYKVGIYSLAI